MNLSGIIKGGLLAGLLINISYFVLHTFVVPVPEEAAGSMAFWVAYAFVLGIMVAYLYAVARPRWGAGPKAAVSAGILVWVLHDLMPGLGMLNMGMGADMGMTAGTMITGLVWAVATMALCGYLAGRLYTEA